MDRRKIIAKIRRAALENKKDRDRLFAECHQVALEAKTEHDRQRVKEEYDYSYGERWSQLEVKMQQRLDEATPEVRALLRDVDEKREPLEGKTEKAELAAAAYRLALSLLDCKKAALSSLAQGHVCSSKPKVSVGMGSYNEYEAIVKIANSMNDSDAGSFIRDILEPHHQRSEVTVERVKGYDGKWRYSVYIPVL